MLLPRYSPDLQPIEGVFAKLKEYLCHARARSSETIHQAIARSLATITTQDARGFFTHCGYHPIS